VNVVRSIDEVRAALEPHRAGKTIALVPTMGAFHAGHVALFRAARAAADVVVASLFVNPAQFDDPTDLDGYPHDAAHDAKVARKSGVDLLFVPKAEEVYPTGFQTWVDVEHLGAELEGAHRPGHFRAVATVCLKLFNIVQPQLVFFGQKDAQQVAVVKRMVRDLNVDVDVRVVPIVRDEDGLALSSRNARLTPEQRARALALPRALATKDAARARKLLADLDVDYVEIADFEPRVLAAAVRVGDTRLIDNVVLEGANE
jgi:pantoate--beta-alanine ligase